MFCKKSRSEKATEAARQQAAALREKAAPLAGAASGAALAAVSNARDWATPRLERARDRGVERAAPHLESAAKALGPRVDEVHDRLVDELLPKVVAVVNAAADAAADRAHEAQKVSHAQLDNVAHTVSTTIAPKKRKSGGFARFLLIFSGLAAAGGAGYAVWKRRSTSIEDPWASAAAPRVTPSPTSAPVTPPVKPADKVADAKVADSQTAAAEADTAAAEALSSDNVESATDKKSDPLAKEAPTDRKPGEVAPPKTDPSSGDN